MSHKVSRLGRLPSWDGTAPENWFASRVLIWSGAKKQRDVLIVGLQSTQLVSELINEIKLIWETYRFVRVVIDPSSFGISPDKRFARTDLENML